MYEPFGVRSLARNHRLVHTLVTVQLHERYETKGTGNQVKSSSRFCFKGLESTDARAVVREWSCDKSHTLIDFHHAPFAPVLRHQKQLRIVQEASPEAVELLKNIDA